MYLSLKQTYFKIFKITECTYESKYVHVCHFKKTLKNKKTHNKKKNQNINSYPFFKLANWLSLKKSRDKELIYLNNEISPTRSNESA